MSNDEWKELSEKLHYGLALAEQRMLEKKAQISSLAGNAETILLLL